MSQDLFEFSGLTMDGRQMPLAELRGKVVLVVNTASKCGFTPQFEGLEALYQTYKDQGFEILGFPCNQFAHQEPADNESILDFCTRNYGVSFTMFQKVDVNGEEAHPLFKYLKSQAPGLLGTEAIKWNFTKFLVDQEGKVIARFAPKDTPEKIAKAIASLLQ